MNQIEWERQSLDSGAEKFAYSEWDKRRAGNTDTTLAGLSIIRQSLVGVAKSLEYAASTSRAGHGGAYRTALRQAATRVDRSSEFYHDWNTVAYISLCTVLQAAYHKDKKRKFLTALAIDLGGRLEEDQKLYVFAQDNPAFVGKIQSSLDAQGVSSYSHRLRTFQKKYRDAEDFKWSAWGKLTRLQVGLKCIRAIIAVMPDYIELTKKSNGKHLAYHVDTSLDMDDIIAETTELRALASPLSRPLIAPPIPYSREDGLISGGYHTPAMRNLAPFIKTRGEAHKEFVAQYFPYKHMTAVNLLQSTAWAANRGVVDVVLQTIKIGGNGVLPSATKLQVPQHPGEGADGEAIQNWKVDCKRVHGRNKQNTVALMQLQTSLDFLRMIGDDPFWFTYSADFRGRLYCNSPLASLQGEDHLKAMIRFKEGKVLGDEGMFWLAVNGANKFGYDKEDLASRVEWVQDNATNIRNVATGDDRSFMMEADKPFQFLAFCLEWHACGYGTKPDTVSHLPIGLDGSCNGLQHFSALLLDEVGGASTNLLPSEKPNDIYLDVAVVCQRAIVSKAATHQTLRLLAAREPDRKLTKRPVMTLPYGATQQSCRRYVREWILDNAEACGVHPDDDKAQWEATKHLAPLVWEAIGKVVVAARAGMDWLQKCATLASKKGVFLRWISPADFPVYQHYEKYDSIRVKTQMHGAIQLRIPGAAIGLDAVRARNGIAPNFIHAHDSSHMVLTIIEAMEGRGMSAMACIHDDYGVHACDTAEFSKIIRETFVRMYLDTDWLQSWRKEIERLNPDLKLPDPPEKGSLDIMKVLSSEFFFA